MRPPSLRVEADEPGRRLVLSIALPIIAKRTFAIVVGVIVLIVAIPSVGGQAIDLAVSGPSPSTLKKLAASAIIPALAAAILMVMALQVRVVSRLALDGFARQIEVTESGAFDEGGRAPEIIPIDDLRGITVRASRPDARRSARGISPDLAVTLTLRFLEGSRRPPRQLSLAVSGLDQKEEGADLALRLASAAGFERQRVVRNDPRGVEIEFRTEDATGFTALARTMAAADYARDEVPEAVRAIVTEEATPPFDPASLEADARLVTWDPGREVRFRKPMGLGAILCAPGLLFFLVGPALFIAASLEQGLMNGLGTRVLGALFLGLVAFIPGGLALLVVVACVPRTVVFDWAQRRLRVATLFRRSSHDFSELRALELECVRTTGKGAGHCYCRLTAQVAPPGAEPKAIDILSTKLYSHDPDTPYRMGLPLVTDLSQSLGVPRVVKDYT